MGGADTSGRNVELTPPDGVTLFPSDRITVSIVQPWYLRWLPSATVTLWVTADGKLHVASEDVAA